MRKTEDLTGRKFHHLTVLGFKNADRHGAAHWLCECFCGRTLTGTSKYLKSGHIKSCGCVGQRITQIICEIYPNFGTKGVCDQIDREFDVLYTGKQIVALAHRMGVGTDQTLARQRRKELKGDQESEQTREAIWWRSMVALMPVTPIQFVPENKRFDGRRV